MITFKTPQSKKSEEKLEEERKTPNSNHVVSSKSSHPKKDDTLQGHENIQPEQTQPIPDHLQHNYKFARICSECYVQNKVRFQAKDPRTLKTGQSRVWSPGGGTWRFLDL